MKKLRTIFCRARSIFWCSSRSASDRCTGLEFPIASRRSRRGRSKLSRVHSSLPFIVSKRLAGSKLPGASQTITAAPNITASPKPANASSKSKLKAGNVSRSRSPARSTQRRKEK